MKFEERHYKIIKRYEQSVKDGTLKKIRIMSRDRAENDKKKIKIDIKISEQNTPDGIFEHKNSHFIILEKGQSFIISGLVNIDDEEEEKK